MATKMSKGKTRGNAAVLGSNQYLKKGGKVMAKAQDGKQKGMAKLKPDLTRPGLLYNPSNPNWTPADTSTTASTVKKKRGGLVKAQLGIWKKEKTINEDGSSMTKRTSNNFLTGNVREVTKTKSAEGDVSKSVKVSSRKMGGKIKSKKK